jgi:putative peptidoglycan lipid II flippase
VAIATVLFPTLSRFAARGDMDGFRRTVSGGVRQIAFLLVPTAIVSALLAEPIIRLLFEHGEWRPADTPVVAGALAAFSAGLLFNGEMLMLNRAFFSLQSNWVPTAVALGNLFLNALLDGVFYRFGVWGIALSTAVCNVAGCWALFVLLRRRIGRMDGRAIATSGVRIVVAGVVAGGVGLAVWRGLDDALGRALAAQIVSLGFGLGAATGVYFLACRVLQVQELRVLSLLTRRAGA